MNDSTLTRLVVVRHGEAVWNTEERAHGHLDSELTDLGKRQVQATAYALEKVRFDALYSSDLGRAKETAEIIAGRLDLKITLEPRLRDRDLGVLQGLTIQESISRYPQEYRNFTNNNVDYVLPGGESKRQRHERCISCGTELASRYMGSRILMIVHGGVLDSFFRKSLNISLAQQRTFPIFNAGINEFSVSNNGWRLDRCMIIDHLQCL
ncbi:MAG: histidine phosphatase family protein [Deltaproteobacteria bacterium]|nr:histidine phosphatase family protein [Deltaproteobacteria bacterium]MBL7174608.1 histidine phosphatase family protein [Desulfobacteraceae bacterium]